MEKLFYVAAVIMILVICFSYATLGIVSPDIAMPICLAAWAFFIVTYILFQSSKNHESEEVDKIDRKNY